MRSNQAEEAAQPVERLNHRRDHSGVTAITGDLADRRFEAADQIFGLLLFLVGHVGCLLQGLSGSSRSSSCSVSSRRTSRGVERADISAGVRRQPRQPQSWHRIGTCLVNKRRTRSANDRGREWCSDTLPHTGHESSTVKTYQICAPRYTVRP